MPESLQKRRNRLRSIYHARRAADALPGLWTALTILLLMAAGGFAPGPAFAKQAETAAICDRAAGVAARDSSVPLSVLRAVTRTETGRARNGQLTPWPWTVNMEGTGKWFATQDEARAYVFRHFKAGARSFDVGCFQINYKWHHTGFRSLDDMFDPVKNAKYAARYLTQLRDELGSWDAAVGAYHSRTEALASRYLKRYRAIHATLPTQDTGPAPLLARRMALLDRNAGTGAARGRFGSLVPSATHAKPLIQMD